MAFCLALILKRIGEEGGSIKSIHFFSHLFFSYFLVNYQNLKKYLSFMQELNRKPKSFWQRPEGKTGGIFGIALIGAGIYGFATLLPTLVACLLYTSPSPRD